MGHARAIVSAGEEDVQMDLLQKIIEEGLSVRDVEAFVKGKKEKTETPVVKAEPSTANVSFDEYQSNLSEKLDTKVQISANNKGKGKIVINFGSEKQLGQIMDFIDQLDA